MSNSTKKGFGVYATLVSAVLAIAAAVIYQGIGGKFGCCLSAAAWCPARWWG